MRGPQLVDERLHVEALQRERREHAVEHLGVVEVALDRLVDAGVLHLHRDHAAVGQHGPVHLADRRRRDRDRVPVEEEVRRGRRRARSRTTSRPGSAPSAARRPAAWPARPAPRAGRPSAMKQIIWPAFMMAPFMLPSSRATSSAVRMANCSSSAARRLRVGSGPAHLHHRVVRTAPSGQPPDSRRSLHATAAVSVGESEAGSDAGSDEASGERRRRHLAGHGRPRSARGGGAARRRSEQSTACRRRSAGRRPRTPRRCRRRGGPSLVRHPRGRLRPARGQRRPRGSRQRSRCEGYRRGPRGKFTQLEHRPHPRRGTVVLVTRG